MIGSFWTSGQPTIAATVTTGQLVPAYTTLTPVFVPWVWRTIQYGSYVPTPLRGTS